MSDLLRAIANIPTALEADISGLTWGSGAWFLQLQPGSWRGVGFVMDVAQCKAGRRVAVHEYPYRPTIWAEDLGLLPRRFAVQAYLTGDDVYQQRDAMIAACETAGPGALVHPTMGTMQVVLLDFSVTDRREHGRMVEIALAFIVSGDVQFPASSIATGNAVTSAFANLNAASLADLSASAATWD
jgi:prophage DNA circulation protein